MKAIKAWAIVSLRGALIGYDPYLIFCTKIRAKRSLISYEEEKVVPVLITPIPKQRKKK